MQEVDKRQIYRELRQFCFGYKEEYTRVSNVVDQYYLLADIISAAIEKYGRRGRKKVIYTADIMSVVSKTFSVSSQTLYRSRAAVAATRSGRAPKKYAIKSFRNINSKIRSW